MKFSSTHSKKKIFFLFPRPKITSVFFALFPFVFSIQENFSFAQTTYTWIGASGGSWAVSTNWSPTRTTPATSDILQFNSGTVLTVTAVTTPQTIQQLIVTNNTDVSLQSSASGTLTLGSAATTNVLTVDLGSTLQVSSTGAISLTIAFPVLATLSTSVAGTIIINANTGLTNAVNFTNLLSANNTITGTITNNGGTITSTTATTIFGAGSFYNHARNGGAIPTATYNATSTVNITGITITNPSPFTGTYGNLIWNCTGQTSATGAASGVTTVSGNLTVSSGTFSDGGFQITGNAGNILSVASGSTLQIGAGGATLETFPTLFTNANISLASGSTIIFNTTGAQSISGVPAYSNPTISGNSIKTAAASLTINGNLTVNAGTLADGAFQIAGNVTGTLMAAAAATLQIGAGTATVTSFPTNFTTANISLNPTSTVNYNTITNPQTVSSTPSSYGNLTITGASGTKTAAGAITVAGTLTIATAGETFADGGNTITVKGNVTNNATHSGVGKIYLNSGSALHTVTSAAAGTFGNIELDDAFGAAFTNTISSTTISGTLTITSGNFDLRNFSTGLTVSGTTSIAVGTTISFTTSPTGTKTFTGDVTNNGTWSNTINSAITFAGNLIHNGTTFTAGTGTYTFSGAGKTISGTTSSISIPSMTVSGTCTNNISTLTVATALAGAGTLTMGTNTTLNIGGTSLGITLNCTTNTPNTVVYNGGGQTVRGFTYYNLTISTSTTATQGASSTTNNNLSVTSGTFADGAFQIVGNATGTLSVSAGATLQIGNGGTTITSFPTLFTTANISLNATSTVNYSTITNPQTVSSVPSSYGNLTITGASGTKTAAGALVIAGTLTVATAGETFADGGNIITVNGNVVMTGIHSGAGKIFLSGGSAVHNLSGVGTFNNLELNDAQGATMTGSIIVGGTLTLTFGTFSVAGFTLTLNGAAIAGTSTNLSTGTTSILSFGPVTNANAGLFIPSSVSNLGNLTINIVSTNSVTINSSITLNNATGLTLTSGRLILGNNDLTLISSSTISGGSASSFVVADATGGNTGQLKKIFPAGINTTFTFPVGDNSGSVEYSPVQLTNFNPAGATATIGVIVNDATHAQINSNYLQTNYLTRYWTFTESGAFTSYSYSTITLTYINTASDVVGTVSTANDQINRWDGSNWWQLNSTVTAPSVSTSQTFTNISGTLGGNDFAVRYNPPQTYTWLATSGSASWAAAASWNPARITPCSTDILQFNQGGTSTATNIPSETENQILLSNSTAVTFNSTGASTISINGTTLLNNISIANGSTLTLGATVNLTYVTTASQRGDISGTLNVNTSGTFNTSAIATTVVTVSSTGAITNNGGTFTTSAATLAFANGSFYNHAMNGGSIPTATYNATSTVNITGITTTNLVSGLTGTFGNLTWNTSGQTASGLINGALTLAGNLTVTSGTINFGANNVNVAGNVSNSGTVNTSTAGATLTMNGSSAQTISGGGTWTTGTTGRLLNLTINNSAGIDLQSNLTIQTGLTLTSGALSSSNSSSLTLGIGAASTLTTTRTNGSLTMSAIFNLASVTYNINYNSTVPAIAITSGNELPPVSVANYLAGTVTIANPTASGGVILNVNSNVFSLTINAATTFADNGNILTVKGNLTNNGTHSGAGKIYLNGGTASHTISGTPATFGNLELDDVQNATWTSAGTTTVSGTLTVTSGTLSVGAFTTSLSVTGATNIATGATFSVTSVTGTKTFTGDVTNNGTWSNTGNSAITFAGNLIHNGTTFTAGTGIYTFSGAGKTISGTTATLSIPSMTVSGTCTNNITTLTVATALAGAGTLTMGANTTLNIGGTSLGITLNCTANTPNTVVYNGAGQTVRGFTYYNLTISTSTTATQGASSTTNNNLSVTSGTFADGAFQIVGNATGTLSVAAGATLQIGTGTVTVTSFPTLFTAANISLNATSTVNYNTITNPQTVSAVPSSYGNLTVTGASGTKTAAGALLIAGTLTIATAGETFADGGNTITVNGNVVNNATHSGAGKILLSGGSAAHNLSGGGTFNNLELNDAQGATMTGNIIVGGTLTLTAGTFSVAGNTLTLNGPNVAGTAANLSTSTTSVLVFGGASAGVNIPSGASQLGSLTVNNANGISLTSNITVNSATGLTLTSGKLFLGNFDFTYASTSTTTAGTLNSTNMIVADATGGNTGQVKKTFPTGSPAAFTFALGDVSATADYSPATLTLTSNNVVRTIGIKVNDNVHPNNGAPADFISRYWTFTDDVAGGTYSYTLSMNYSAPADLTGLHANLTVNRWDGFGWTQYTTSGVSPTITTSAAQTNSGNPLGGSDFTGRSATAPTTYTWNQTGTADWTVAANWTPARTTPSSADILQFNNGATTIATNVPTQTVRQLLVTASTNVSLQSSAAITLSINGPGATNNLQVANGSTLQLSSSGANSINLTIVTTASQLGDISGNFILNSNSSNNNTLTTNSVGTTIVTVSSTGIITNNGGTITSGYVPKAI